MDNDMIYILNSDSGSLEEANGPDLVASRHELWRRDAALFSPWKETRWPDSGPERIKAWRGTADSPAPLVLVADKCSSSLDLAWKFTRQGILPEWGSVLCVSQSAGRGRMRRPWTSPPGNIHAALAWPERLSLARGAKPETTSLLIGLVMADALESFGLDIRLKWPNDLLLKGKKVAGILVEERGGACMAGIGINLAAAPSAEELRNGFAVRASTLAPYLSGLGPLSLWRTIVSRAEHTFTSWLSTYSIQELLEKIESKLAWIGREVLISDRGANNFDKSRSVIIGLAGDGALRVLVEGDEHVIYSGSIAPITQAEDK